MMYDIFYITVGLIITFTLVYLIIMHFTVKNYNKIKVETTAISSWVRFDFNDISTRPKEYGKYLICRKDGKIHWETWNGSGWAYNQKEIIYWAIIEKPF